MSRCPVAAEWCGGLRLDEGGGGVGKGGERESGQLYGFKSLTKDGSVLQ
jgi:hypothetical protein